MNRMKRRLALLLTALMGAALAACGGGGGGGSAELSSVPYTGNTVGAVITTQNATEIALSAYSGGQMDGMSGVLPMAVGPAGADANQVPRLEYLLDLAQDLRDMALSGLPTPGGDIQMQNYSDWWPENGQCGGTAKWSGTSDPDAANGSVTFTFTNYCEGGITLSGKIKVDWSMVAATVTFDPLNVTTGSFTGTESFTIGGEIRFTWSDNPDGWNDTTTLNMVLLDQVAGKSYKFENYRLSETFSHVEMFEQFVLSGRYYDFDHGRVDITTTTPVLFHWEDAGWWPRQGIIQFNGDSSFVRMTFLSDGVMIEWRPSLSSESWHLVEIIPRNDFDMWF